MARPAHRTPNPVVDATRPQIGWDVARAVAACEAAVAECAPVPGVDVAGAVEAVIDALVARTTGEMPRVDQIDVIGAALAVMAATHARDAHRRAHAAKRTKAAREARALDATVGSGAFVETIREAWLSQGDEGTFEEVVSALTLRGLDGERLGWAVICYEAQRHIRLIWHEANKLTKHFPDRRSADLFGWGWQGLRVALRNYDPARGFRFSTYACQRISGAIRDGVRSESPIPKRLTTFVRKVAKAEEELTASLGRVPELHEVATHLGETLDVLRILPRLTPTASLDEMAAAGGGQRTNELPRLIDSEDPADVAIEEARRTAIADALTALSDEEATAVRLLLYEGRSVAEARAETGATARQLRHRCARGREVLAEVLADWA